MLQITGAKFVGPDISIEDAMLLYLLQCVTVCCSVLQCVDVDADTDADEHTHTHSHTHAHTQTP